MNDKKRQNLGKDCAYIAVFVALTIAAQLCLSFLPGVEVVTVLFITFSFVFGCRRGVAAATVFSLLRQLIFGFFPTVLKLCKMFVIDFSHCWMLYTSDGEMSNAAWGEIEYNGEKLGSAVLGADALPVLEGQVYVWYYQAF